jgi:hypothetical protein
MHIIPDPIVHLHESTRLLIPSTYPQTLLFIATMRSLPLLKSDSSKHTFSLEQRKSANDGSHGTHRRNKGVDGRSRADVSRARRCRRNNIGDGTRRSARGRAGGSRAGGDGG